MNSTPNPEAIAPNDVLIARADERLARLSKLDDDAARPASVVLGRLPSRGGPMLRGLIGLLLAACILVAALVSQSSYGDAAKPIIARWAPQLISASSLPLEKPGLAAQPSSSAVQLAAAEPVPLQPTPSAQAAPQDVAPTAVPVSPEPAKLLQTVARDLANVEREIEQLNSELASFRQKKN